MQNPSVKNEQGRPPDFEPELFFESGRPRCIAWVPGKGRQCRKSPMTGKSVCGKHGGPTPSGVASPHYKNGEHIRRRIPVHYRAIVGGKLESDYERFMAELEQLDLSGDLAINHGRIEALLEAIEADQSVSGELLGKLRRNTDAAIEAMILKDVVGVRDSILAQRDLLDRAGREDANWDRLDRLQDQRMKLVSAQMKSEMSISLTRVIALTVNLGTVFQTALEKHAGMVLDGTLIDSIIETVMLAGRSGILSIGHAVVDSETVEAAIRAAESVSGEDS